MMKIGLTKEVKAFLKRVEKASTLVVDLETNRLNAFNPNAHIIGYSLYIPDLDEGMYIPVKHGLGSFDVDYSDRNTAETPFHKMTWQGKTKRTIWLNYWWAKFHAANMDLFSNYDDATERAVIEALKKSSSRATWIFHNAMFDMTWLSLKGIPMPTTIYDTMIGMHVVHEDLLGVYLEAPYRWSEKDAVEPSKVGRWARDKNENLKEKRQKLGYRLKDLSAMLGFPEATEGEDDMQAHNVALQDTLIEFILSNMDDPYNVKLKPEDVTKKVREVLSEKSAMWLIPASGVQVYALYDGILTWKLHNYILERCVEWDNEDLYPQQCQVLRYVSWPAYRYGIRCDINEAKRQYENLLERKTGLEVCLADMALDCMYKSGNILFYKGDYNPASNDDMRDILPAVLTVLPDLDMIPEWWGEEQRAGFLAYEPKFIASVSADALEDYTGHPFVIALLEHRKTCKGMSTYLLKWIEGVDKDSNLHFKLNGTGTVSGRFSGGGGKGDGEPGNPQNIPDRNGYELKKALQVSSVLHAILGVDFGQLELRLACWIAEVLLGLDRNRPMTTLFLQDKDMHAYTRDRIQVEQIVWGGMSDAAIMTKLGYNLKKQPEDTWREIITTQARFIAKTMNFGLLYGGGAGMLSALLHLDYKTSEVLVKSWRALFPAFQRANYHFAREAGKWRANKGGELHQFITQPISGRHRRFDLYDLRGEFIDKKTKLKKIYNPRQSEMDKAWNNLVQGLGGEITKDSALELALMYHNAMMDLSDDMHIFNVIHDSIDAFVQADKITSVIDNFKRVMTAWDVIPGLTVDVQVAEYNWQMMYPWVGYWGVGWNKKAERWTGFLEMPDAPRVQLGLFDSKEDAARARDDEALRVFGRSVKLNEILLEG